MEAEIHEYDVALSFAGEDRRYVEEVSCHLCRMGIRCFYDKSEEVDLWGKNLYEYLTDIYSKKSRYTVMFVSSNYANKMWTNLERRSAQERAFQRTVIIYFQYDLMILKYLVC